MKGIAERITGMTKEELWEYNFPSAHSYTGAMGAHLCRNVRLFSGLSLISKDIEIIRVGLKNAIPRALRKN